jgi:hypothetical protein
MRRFLLTQKSFLCNAACSGIHLSTPLQYIIMLTKFSVSTECNVLKMREF